MKNKVAILLAATTLLASGAAAQNIQTEFYPNQTTLEPGNQTQVGQLEITAGNTTLSNIEINPQYPFQVTANPSTRQGLNPNSSFNTSITANPDESTPPGDYTRAIRVTTASSSVSPRFTLSIPSLRTWDTGTNQVNQTISVGSSGNFGSIPVNGTGNRDIQLNINATGNLTEYIDIRETVSVFPGVTTEIPVNYAVPRTTSFGYYNTSVQLRGGGKNRTVQLTSRFRDEIAPEITSFNVPDVQATQTEEFSVEASDNLKVGNVTGEILREVETRRNNQTVFVNQTFVENAKFERESENSRVFTYTFEDSDQEGQYHVNLSVEDEAGNTATGVRSFTVDRLNGTLVLEPNFRFQSVEPGSEAEQTVFENLIATPVNVTLERLSHEKENSSISIGLRSPGDDVPEQFEEEGDAISVEDRGRYELVVESDEVEEYDGRISLEAVPQARQPRDVVFSGEVIDPVYPVPQNYSIGRFSGTVSYADNDTAEKQTIVMELRGSAEDCRGFDQFEQCISGFSLNEIPKVEAEKQKAIRERNLAIGASIFSFLFLGFYLLKERRIGLHTFVERVEIE